MTGLTWTGLVAAIAIASATASTAADDPNDYDKFALWTDCKPVALQIVLAPGNTGLTEEEVAVVSHTRLRSARLYEDTFSDPFLRVSVEVNRNVYYIGLRFHRFLLTLPPNALTGWATTWEVSSFGFIESYGPGVVVFEDAASWSAVGTRAWPSTSPVLPAIGLGTVSADSVLSLVELSAECTHDLPVMGTREGVFPAGSGNSGLVARRRRCPGTGKSGWQAELHANDGGGQTDDDDHRHHQLDLALGGFHVFGPYAIHHNRRSRRGGVR